MGSTSCIYGMLALSAFLGCLAVRTGEQVSADRKVAASFGAEIRTNKE